MLGFMFWLFMPWTCQKSWPRGRCSLREGGGGSISRAVAHFSDPNVSVLPNFRSPKAAGRGRRKFGQERIVRPSFFRVRWTRREAYAVAPLRGKVKGQDNHGLCGPWGRSRRLPGGAGGVTPCQSPWEALGCGGRAPGVAPPRHRGNPDALKAMSPGSRPVPSLRQGGRDREGVGQGYPRLPTPVRGIAAGGHDGFPSGAEAEGP